DPTGKRTSRQSIGGSLSTGASDLPIVEWPPNKWAVFTPDGDKLLEVAADSPRGTRLVGTKLFAGESDNSAFPRWGQYDLKTGAKGKTCEFDMGNRYLGTDGSVGVFRVDNP